MNETGPNPGSAVRCGVHGRGAAVVLLGIAMLCMPGSTTAQPAAASTSQSRAWVARADSLFDEGEWLSAAAAYDSALVANPADGESAYLQGIAYQRLGLWDQAATAYRLASIYQPRRGSGLYRLAAAIAHIGQVDASVPLLREAIDAGFLHTQWLATDEALDPLRGRPDFQQLLRDQFGESFTEPAPVHPPSAAQMRGGIELLTSTIRTVHPNPYRTYTPEDWDRRTAEAVAHVGNMGEAEYLVELMSLASMAGDVHTSAYPVHSEGVETPMRAAVPIQFWKFPDGLRIRAAAPAYRRLVGAKVLAIGGLPMDSAWPRLLERFHYENEWMAAYMLQFFLRFPDFLRGVGLSGSEGAADLRLQLVDGSIEDISLRGEDAGGYGPEMGRTLGFQAPDSWLEGHDGAPTPEWLSARDRAYWFKMMPDRNSAYFQFNLPRFDPAHPWSAFLEALSDSLRANATQRLVIDLRHNEGGWDYMAYDLVDRIRSVPSLEGLGHVVVLIGRLVQSAGVTIATVLEREVDAVFVGEPVGAHPNFFNGRWGNHPPMALPGTRIRFRVSTLEEQYSDPLDDRRFVAPDVWAQLEYEDYAAGRDRALEIALSLSTGDAERLFQDPGGRPIERYFRWRRPSQHVAFPASARDVP